MKAVSQNTMFSLLCMATVVLAAPNPSLSKPKAAQTVVNDAEQMPVSVFQGSCEDPDSIQSIPSILDETARFTCW